MKSNIQQINKIIKQLDISKQGYEIRMNETWYSIW